MPAWVRKSISKKTWSVAPSTSASALTETDPSTIGEIAAADEQKGFLNIESMSVTSGTFTLYVYRWEGARPDLMRRLDAAGAAHLTLTSSGINNISWVSPSGAVRKVTLEAQATPGTGSITLELDDVYRSNGS